MSDDIRTRVILEADDRSSKAAAKSVGTVTNELKALEQAGKITNGQFQTASAEAKNYAAQMKVLEAEINRANAKLKTMEGASLAKHEATITRLQARYARLGDSLENVPRKLEAAFDRADARARKAASVYEQFDEVSRNVGLAGDVQSNLGAIRGLTGVAGFGGVSGAVGVAGEVAALTEELPRLATAFKGLPQTLSAATQALGGIRGVGLVGALGVAAVGFLEVKRRADEAAAAARAQAEAQARALIESNQSFNEVLIEGSDAVRNYRDGLIDQNRTLELAQNQLLDLGDAYDAVLNANNVQLGDQVSFSTRKYLTDILLANEEFVAAYEALGTDIEGFDFQQLNLLFDSFRENEQTIARNANNIERSNQVLEDNTFAAEEAARAERELSETRLVEAERIRNNTLRTARLAEQSASSLEDRISAISTERTALEAARQSLIASGDASEEAQKQIDGYTQSINDLNSEQSLARSFLDAARARELQAEKEEEFVETVREANAERERINQQFNDARAQAEDRYQAAVSAADEKRLSTLDRLAERLDQQEASLREKAARELVDEEAKIAFERQQQLVEFRREDIEAERELAQEIRDIREKAADDEANAIRRRDFASIFFSQQDTESAIAKAQRDADEAAAIRDEERQQAIGDEAAQLAFERQQRQVNYQRQLDDAREQFERERAQAEELYTLSLDQASKQQRQTNEQIKRLRLEGLRTVEQTERQQLALIASGSTARIRQEIETQKLLSQAHQILYTQAANMVSRAGRAGQQVGGFFGGQLGLSGSGRAAAAATTNNFGFNIASSNPQGVRNEVVKVMREFFT